MTHKILLISAVLGGILLRILGAYGDLWLDEIWALRVLERPISLPILNGHLSLYTLWGLILPTHPDAFVYRVPAVAASIGFLIVLSYEARRATYLFFPTVWLASLSYPLVLYGSEGRGYAFLPVAALIVLVAFAPLPNTSENSPRSVLARDEVVWGTAVAATLFHLSFFLYFSACSCAFFLRTLSGKNTHEWFRRCLPLHVVLAVLVGGATMISESGGGPPTALFELLVSSVSVSWGGPLVAEETQLGSLFYALAVLTLSIVCYREMRVQKQIIAAWCFEVAAITFFFVFSAFVFTGQHAAMRYLLGGLVAWYAGVGGAWVYFWKKGSLLHRTGLVFCFFIFSAGSLYHGSLLIRYGRGTYSQALLHINDLKDGARVATDHFFRNKTVAEFVKEKHGLSLEVVDSAELNDSDFFIAHDFAPYGKGQRENIPGDIPFKYERSFFSAPLSGWTWHLYRKEQY